LQKTNLPANYFAGGKVLPNNIFNEFAQIQIDLIGIERQTLASMRQNGQTSEEVIRKIERELDLEEARLQMEMFN
jgi:CPA1 family monovalent cation:H+ antiporter